MLRRTGLVDRLQHLKKALDAVLSTHKKAVIQFEGAPLGTGMVFDRVEVGEFDGSGSRSHNLVINEADGGKLIVFDPGVVRSIYVPNDYRKPLSG